MHYKILNLKSFGQFTNRALHFEPGINLVVGRNEAGKTTALNAIYGIFFGFTNLKELYKPWHNPQEYKASIEFTLENISCTLERDFLTDEVILDQNGARFQAKISPQGRRSERSTYL